MGKINHFINQSVAILSNTLIDVDMAKDKSTLDLSDFSTGVSRITSLGDSCLSKNDAIENLILPPSIEHITPRSFSGLSNLKLVKFIDVKVSHEDYERYKHFMTYIGNNIYNMDYECARMGNGVLLEALTSLSSYLLASTKAESDTFNPEYKYIFTIPKPEFYSKTSFFRMRRIITPGEEYTNKSEDDIIKEMIASGNLGYLSKDAEMRGEVFIKSNSVPFLTGGIVMTCENESVLNSGAHLLTITFERLISYFPSLLPVSYDSKNYWVYRRCIIEGNSYFPVVMAIYGEDGVITDENLLRSVYDKYKLLSIV